MRKMATHKFSIFTLKNVTWRTYLNTFTVQYCFLFRFVCIELVLLTWCLQIWVAIYVYGTMIKWSTLINKLMQTYIVMVSGSILNLSTYLTPHMTLSIETCIRRADTTAFPEVVRLIQVSLYLYSLFVPQLSPPSGELSVYTRNYKGDREGIPHIHPIP